MGGEGGGCGNGEGPPILRPRGLVSVYVCSVHAVMKNAEKHMREALAADKLSDLAARVTAKAPRTFGTQVVKWLDERTGQRRAARA